MYLVRIASRTDLNYLFEETMGELSGGAPVCAEAETVRRSGTSPSACWARTTKSRTGATASPAIYDGEAWNPQLRAPLTQPGVNVSEGEYLLAVNGRQVTRKR